MAHSLKDKNLIPLHQRFPDFKGLDNSHSKSRQVHAYLVRSIRTLRSHRAAPFYSIPDVADFFGLSRSAVAKIYQELNREGLIQSRRGSATQVAPRQTRPKARLVGVVAMPIWTPGFLQFAEVRRFQRTLEVELRRYGFALIPIFFRQGEELEPSFIARLSYHQPDIVLWMDPAEADHQPIAALRDAGEKLCIVSTRSCFAKEKYILEWTPGIRSLLQTWQQQGIKRIVVPGWNEPYFQTVPGLLAESHHLDLYVDFFLQDPTPYGGDAQLLLDFDPNCALFCADDLRFNSLCTTNPVTMSEVLRRFPTAVTHPFGLPKELLPGIHTDAVMMDWDAMAKTISRDIADGNALVPANPVHFQARHLANLSAADLLEQYGGE